MLCMRICITCTCILLHTVLNPEATKVVLQHTCTNCYGLGISEGHMPWASFTGSLGRRLTVRASCVCRPYMLWPMTWSPLSSSKSAGDRLPSVKLIKEEVESCERELMLSNGANRKDDLSCYTLLIITSISHAPLMRLSCFQWHIYKGSPLAVN